MRRFLVNLWRDERGFQHVDTAVLLMVGVAIAIAFGILARDSVAAYASRIFQRFTGATFE